ncbi:hypothetical protein TMO_a0177 (plasmid) [Tistrella mobilis KA081020-065]|uniref:Uncharacterized protein n=1 Tax=Tistrella mobilis (strain KA081020-065) TaxID=1110502 RepID=I3TS42_TISMK|nr:hypothetical protein TMO_a0177 [Tistrella mobilis KA081020-065]
MGVGREGDDALFRQIIDDPLHVLAIGAQIAGQPGHRLRPVGIDDRAQNLPARAGQPQRRHQPVAPGERQIVHPEQTQDQIGQGRGPGGMLVIGHASSCEFIDTLRIN